MPSQYFITKTPHSLPRFRLIEAGWDFSMRSSGRGKASFHKLDGLKKDIHEGPTPDRVLQKNQKCSLRNIFA
jgi:hypothetical protein